MRHAHRCIRTKLESGERVFGSAIQIPSAEIAEITGAAGFDFAWIDADHGAMDLGDIRQLIRGADASGIDAIVRLPDCNPKVIQQVLDIGAAGVSAGIATVSDAAGLVSAAKYAPNGTRRACPATRSLGGLSLDWRVEYREANADVLVFGQIDSREGVENAAAIASEAGLDGLIFGPFELAQSGGLEGDVTHPDIDSMHQRVISAASDAGIEYVAIAGWDRAGTSAAADCSRIVVACGDRGSLLQDFRTRLAAVS